jgi:hypothetical protein
MGQTVIRKMNETSKVHEKLQSTSIIEEHEDIMGEIEEVSYKNIMQGLRSLKEWVWRRIRQFPWISLETYIMIIVEVCKLAL